MKEGYKKTELGWIPDEWEIKQLKNLGESIIGLTYSPDNLVDEEGTLVLRSSNIKGNRLSFNDNKYVNKKIPDKLITKENDILVCSRNGSKDLIGKCALIDKNSVGNSFGAFMTIYRGEYNQFLFQVFNSFMLKRQIYNNLGATINQITTDNLNKFKVPFPPLKEQQKIAEILSTVDTQIDDTDKLIEKTKELKKGLMQRLLTKGIGHTEFKMTEVGEIPVEWEVKKIIDISDTTSGGTPSRRKKCYYENGNICWVKTGELSNKYIYDTKEKITDAAVKESSAKLVPINSVIVAMYGATIGKISINRREVTTNQACCSIICKENVMDYEFLFYNLSFNKEKLIQLGAGGAQPNISQQVIKAFKIVVPNLKEQEKIAKILSSVDSQVEEYENEKVKLEELKKGLMQQLLTGKIRAI